VNIREYTEKLEYDYLSPYAAKAVETTGRDRPEEFCDIRTEYQRDRDRILHSKSFRRLKHKTQVFLAPEGDHYRTRLTHTLEVAQIARTISKALRLNEDLTEAIALGHDLGHTPFGHAGERLLNEISEEGFSHCEQSVRVVEVLEKGGTGLNLTKEVRNGILNHRSGGHPATLEGRVVQLSDKIAYINHDMDDAIRADILTEKMLPPNCRQVLGRSTRERLNTLIHSIVETSLDCPEIRMDETVEAAMKELRKFMFDNLYKGSIAKTEEAKAQSVVRSLYEYYMENTEALPRQYFDLVWIGGDSWSKVVCDYVSGMTDLYAIHRYKELFVPKFWEY